MSKKAKPESPEEQAERFKATVRELIDAGDLDPEEADARFDALTRSALRKP